MYSQWMVKGNGKGRKQMEARSEKEPAFPRTTPAWSLQTCVHLEDNCLRNLFEMPKYLLFPQKVALFRVQNTFLKSSSKICNNINSYFVPNCCTTQLHHAWVRTQRNRSEHSTEMPSHPSSFHHDARQLRRGRSLTPTKHTKA